MPPHGISRDEPVGENLKQVLATISFDRSAARIRLAFDLTVFPAAVGEQDVAEHVEAIGRRKAVLEQIEFVPNRCLQSRSIGSTALVTGMVAG